MKKILFILMTMFALTSITSCCCADLIVDGTLYNPVYPSYRVYYGTPHRYYRPVPRPYVHRNIPPAHRHRQMPHHNGHRR